jgi:uncharacterized protein YjiS (DUF1127 family)
MSDWNSGRPDIRFYIEEAQEARAEAMARVGFLAVATVGRAAGAVAGRARAAFGALAAWRDRQVAVHQLLTLDDRMLRDIGLTRADAWAAVDGTLGSRAQDWPRPETTAYIDIALTHYAAGGCNDNGERRRAA